MYLLVNKLRPKGGIVDCFAHEDTLKSDKGVVKIQVRRWHSRPLNCQNCIFAPSMMDSDSDSEPTINLPTRLNALLLDDVYKYW